MMEGAGFFELLAEEASLLTLPDEVAVGEKEKDSEMASVASTFDESRSDREESAPVYIMDTGKEMEFVSRKNEVKVFMVEENKQEDQEVRKKSKFSGSLKKMSVRLFSKRAKKSSRKAVVQTESHDNLPLHIAVPVTSQPDKAVLEPERTPAKRASFWEQIKASSRRQQQKGEKTIDPTSQWATQMSVSTVSDDSIGFEDAVESIVEVPKEQGASLTELRMALPVAGHEDESEDEEVDEIISTIFDDFDVEDVAQELEETSQGCSNIDFPSHVETTMVACVDKMDVFNACGCRVDDICQVRDTMEGSDISATSRKVFDHDDKSSNANGSQNDFGGGKDDQNESSNDDDGSDGNSIEEETFEATVSTYSFDDGSEYDDFKKAMILLKRRAASRGLTEEVLLEKIRTEQKRRESLVGLVIE